MLQRVLLSLPVVQQTLPVWQSIPNILTRSVCVHAFDFPSLPYLAPPAAFPIAFLRGCHYMQHAVEASFVLVFLLLPPPPTAPYFGKYHAWI